MDALDALVADKRREDIWRVYAATMLNAIGRVVGGKHWQFPTYDSIIYPDRAKRADRRSGKQIIQHLRQKLLKG